MNEQAGCVRPVGYFLHSLEGHHCSARMVLCVLDRDQTGLGKERRLRSNARFDCGPIHDSIRTLNRVRERAADDCHPSHLHIEHVAALFDDYFLSGLCMKPHGNLIPHGARGNEQGGVLTEDLGGALLQPIRSWVFAVNVIADFGARHRFAHLVGWFGYGVASKIDVVHCSLSLRLILAEQNKSSVARSQGRGPLRTFAAWREIYLLDKDRSRAKNAKSRKAASENLQCPSCLFIISAAF